MKLMETDKKLKKIKTLEKWKRKMITIVQYTYNSSTRTISFSRSKRSWNLMTRSWFKDFSIAASRLIASRLKPFLLVRVLFSFIYFAATSTWSDFDRHLFTTANWPLRLPKSHVKKKAFNKLLQNATYLLFIS